LTIGRGSEQGGEELLVLLKLDEVRVPDAPAVIFFDPSFTFCLKEANGPEHDLAGCLIRIET
jgi:hypothetical protein